MGSDETYIEHHYHTDPNTLAMIQKMEEENRKMYEQFFKAQQEEKSKRQAQGENKLKTEVSNLTSKLEKDKQKYE